MTSGIDGFIRGYKRYGNVVEKELPDNPNHLSMPFPTREEEQRRKIMERNREYNEFLKTKDKERRRYDDDDDESIMTRNDERPYATLPIGGSGGVEANRRELSEQRHREYNEFIQEKTTQQKELEHFQKANMEHRERPRWFSEERLNRPEEQEQNRPTGLPPRKTQDTANILGGILQIGGVDSREAQRLRKQQYGAELQAQIQAKEEAKQQSKNLDLKVDPTGAVDPEKDPNRIRNLAPKVPIVQYRQGDQNASTAFAMTLPPMAPQRPEPLSQQPPHRYVPSQEPFATHNPYDNNSNVLVVQRPAPEIRFSPAKPLDLSRLDAAIHTDVTSQLPMRPPPQMYSPLAQEALSLLNRRPLLPNATEFAGFEPKDPLMFTPRGEGGFGERNFGERSVKPLPITDDIQFAMNGLLPANLFPSGYQPLGVTAAPSVDGFHIGFQGFGGSGGGGGLGGGGGASERKWRNEVTLTKDEKEIANEKDRKKKEYERELRQQIEEKAQKRAREQEKFLQEDLKKMEEMKNYDPFGRGGGGAPFKDKSGKIVADLKRFRDGGDHTEDNDEIRQPILSPGRNRYHEPVPENGLFGDKPATAVSNTSAETTFARGGHGIFGNPKTDEQKKHEDKYKMALEKQIEEKKKRQEDEKRRMREQDEREARQMHEQNQRAQDEMNREKLKSKFKEDEIRLRNEELIREAGERKAGNVAKFRDPNESSPRIIANSELNDDWARLKHELTEPLPRSPSDTNVDFPMSMQLIKMTHRLGVGSTMPNTGRDQIGLKPYTNSSAETGAVSNQLSQMRKILEDERRRVEDMLKNRENDPSNNVNFLKKDITVGPIKNVDVFEMARLRGAALARRTGSAADARNVDDFTQLKSKKTKSRGAFRKIFPEEPYTNTGLELQQLALLRQQEERLAVFREQPLGAEASLDRDRISAARLQSDTAFLDLDGNLIDLAALEDAERKHREHLEHFEQLPGADRAYRTKRPPSGGSINPDRIMEANQDRLRRLKEAGDDTSLADPDDILDNFMTKQVHNRPGSQKSLYDDTWLYPIGPQTCW